MEHVNVFYFDHSYFLFLKNRPPVDEGHLWHIVHRIVYLSVEGTVFQPAFMEVVDTEVTSRRNASIAVSIILHLRSRVKGVKIHSWLTRSLFLRPAGVWAFWPWWHPGTGPSTDLPPFPASLKSHPDAERAGPSFHSHCPGGSRRHWRWDWQRQCHW